MATHTEARVEQNALPQPWISKLRQQKREEVVAIYGDTQLLAVRIDEPDGEFARTLADGERGPGARVRPSHDALGFATVVGSRTTLEALKASKERAAAAEL